jgi:hypothetical protein
MLGAAVIAMGTLLLGALVATLMIAAGLRDYLWLGLTVFAVSYLAFTAALVRGRQR